MMDRILCGLIYILVAFSRYARFFSKLRIGAYDAWRPGRRLKILLVGYNGARNTGSDARVAAIAGQIKEIFGKNNVQITVMTLDTASLRGYFDEDVTLLQFHSLFPLDLYRACCTHHAAVLCEGSTLKSTFANALTLFMCEAAGIMAAQKKPCIAYGAEVGEMEPFLRRAASKLCRDVFFITRTAGSLEKLRELGLRGHAGTDTAWIWDRYRNTESDPGKTELLYSRLTDQGWDRKKPLLGIAVIDPFCWPVRASLKRWIRGKITGDFTGQYDQWYFFSDSPMRRRAYKRYIHELASAAGRFMRDHDYFPVLLGMERLDERACRDLLIRLGGKGAIFHSGAYPADMMTLLLRRLSLLVTSRYHASVLSMKNGCPIAAVSMDERLDGIMHELGYQERFLQHVTDPDLGEALYRAMADAAANEDEIRTHIRRHEKAYQEKVMTMGAFMYNYIESYLKASLKADMGAETKIAQGRHVRKKHMAPGTAEPASGFIHYLIEKCCG